MTRGSSPLRTAVAPGPAPSRISFFARAMSSSPLKNWRWTGLTLVITATSGGGDPGQDPQLSGGAHAHLEDGRFVVRPEPEEREGQSQAVVEVALGLEDAETAGEQGCRELLGRRLADAPGDAHDLDRPPGEDVAGERLEGGHRILDLDEAEVLDGEGDRTGDDGARRAPGRRGADEVVAVSLPDDGEEEPARGAQPGVDAVAFEGQRGGALQDGPAGDPGDLVEP